MPSNNGRRGGGWTRRSDRPTEGGSQDGGESVDRLGATYFVGDALRDEEKKWDCNNNEENWNCGKCKKLVGEGQNGMGCDICDGWYHCGCIGMSKKDYDCYGAIKDAMWICKECKDHARNAKGKYED